MLPKYSAVEIGQYRKALLELLQGGPLVACYGVCSNISRILSNWNNDGAWLSGYEFVAEESVDWPHAIKNEVGILSDFFVPHNVHHGLWEGDNLKMRQNLIKYLLGRVAHHEAMLRGGVALAD